MKGTALLLLCAVTLTQAEQPQLTLSGKVCNCNPGEAPKVCSQNGSDDQLIAHENCNQFYKCFHGSAIAYDCPANLLYNPLAEICDWPENVECGNRPIVNPGTESEDCSQENSNSSNEGQDNNSEADGGSIGGTCNCNPEQAPALCAADGSDGVLVAHQNCNQFYKCDHGLPVTLNCPSGLVYNPYNEQCDWPHNVECGDRPIVEIEGGGNNGGEEDCNQNGSGSGSGDGSGGNGNGDNGGTCNCNPGDAPGICAANESDGVLVAHENCNQFYKCDHGTPVVLNCPSNLLYNPYIEKCDWAHNVDCGDRPIVEIEGDGNNDGDEDCGGTGSGNGESGSGNGDNGGDNGTGDNGGTCNCNPGEAPGICSTDGSDGTLVAHENCNQFYKCTHGVPVTINCPLGLVYNPYIECCDWPYNVDCGDKPIVEDGGNGGSDGDIGVGGGNGDSGTGGGTGGNSNEDNAVPCNCNPENAPDICAADLSDGTLVAHQNCNQFYKCAHGVPVTITCPPGLVYNPYIECCDWPANTDCGDKPIVDIESGGNGDNGGGANGDNGTGEENGNNSNSIEDNGNNCNCNPGEAPGICGADGSEGVLVAHENCNQFYKCANGVPVALYCPAGLLYNPYIERCDWPDNVECGDKPIVEGGSNGDNGGGDNGGSDNGGGDNGGGDNGGGENGGGTCNCNPGEAPGICGADGSDGVLVAHENCNQFYKCANGVPVDLYCPAGLLYNPYIERCDWPDNVECGDKPIVEGGGNGDNGGGDNGGGENGGGENGGGTCNCNPGEAPGICGADGSDGVLVAHENCNQFYKCANGVPVALYCPAGLLYNPYTERCDWPDNVECGDRPIVEGGGNGDSGGGDNGGDDNGGGDNGGGDNGGTCNCNPGEAPGICGTDGSEGVLVAHENCNQFYKCANGVPVALYCPAGLLYNPYIERCDWPDNVECGDKPIVEGGGNGDNGGGDNGGGDNGGGDNGGGENGGGENGGGENGGGTCNCNPGEAPGICGADGSDGVLVAHENCNQFYKCANGVPVALYCPAGLLYNPYTERCDWPDNVECGDRPIVEGGGNGDSGDGDNGGGDNGGGDNGGGDNGGTCNCNPGEAPGICGADGSEGILIAHENCNQFYKCANGIPVALYCPAGLLYNPYIERCDWPDNVECGDKPIVEGGGNGDNGGGDNGGGDNGGGDNGGSENGGGENGGGTCNCNPGEAPGICGADGSDGVLVAHENCNQFYKCANGVPVAQYCPAGLLYNPYIERCDWPDNVECGDKPIVEGGGNGDNGGGENGGGDNGGVDNGGTCNCNPGEAPGICGADGSEGVLIAHENCNQFYKCANGIPVALYCPAGLLYNPYIERCDWPDNVKCGDKPIVEGGGNGDNGGGDNGGGDNGGGDNGGGDNGGTCNCNPGEAPGICGTDGSEGVLVAHENCNQFYKCANGVPVAQYCPAGLVYNPYIERCDWPDNVECGDKPIVEGGGNGDNGGGENGGGDNGGGDNGGGDNGGTCNCNPGEAPGICGADGSEGVLVAHENCNQFYKCANGVPVALYCPAGLLYNPYIERCDWPDNVECGDRPIVEGGDNGDNGGGDNGGGDNGGGDNGGGENGGGTCNCNPGEAAGICGTDGSEGVLVAHENCNQFYKCANGVPVALYCPAGLLYDPYIERCDWPVNVECGGRPVVEVEGNNNGGENDISKEDNDGETNNTDNCDPSQAPSICAASESEGVLVAHENCNQFYKCADGVPVALDCPSGLLYNSVLQVCDWQQNVDCANRAIPDSEENNINDGGDNGGDNEGDNGSSGGNCDPGQAPTICAKDGSNGVLIAHENCDQFYVCSYGKPVALNCPSNLLYNPAIEQCDWPKNVDCGDRVITKPDSGGEDVPCSCNAREAPFICSRRDSNGKLIAHNNCNKYYVCFEGIPVARSCPQNLFYEPHTQQCLWPASVNCEGRVITSISSYTSLNKHTQARRGFF